jgi:hypothetical protein
MHVAFFQKSMHEASEDRSRQIRDYVKRLPVTDFDTGDKDQMCQLIAAKFQFPEMPQFATGQVERDEPVFREGDDRVSIKVYFPFTGELSMFQLYHQSRPMIPPPPEFDLEHDMLVKNYTLSKQELATIDQKVNADVKHVEQFAKPVREMIPKFNEHLLAVAKEAFNNRASELNQNKQAAATLSQSKMTIRKRAGDPEKTIVPVKRKQIVVGQPSAPVDQVREYVLGLSEYDDILDTISSMAKVMERTPSVFAPMNEEPLRTILLVALNGIYEGQATGETFNGHGKTDILIRRDNRNVFIAECLMWKGQAYLQKKMDEQLFQYAMWRDSKLALIVFNRGGNFTHVIDTMKATLKAHPQFVKQLDWSHESGARYLFRRHDDEGRHFLLTALAFDVPSGDQIVGTANA